MSFTADQIILVTGASSGIGRAVAEQCLAEGATVLAAATNMEKLEAAGAGRERWISVPRDLLAKTDDLPAWVGSLAKLHGRLWGLAHCAGIGLMDTLRSYDPADSRKIFEIDFQAPLLLAKGFADRRANRKGGGIVFIASAAGVFPEKGHLAYGAAKAALIAAAKSASQELAPMGIRVNCLSPGIVDTPMEAAAEALAGPMYREKQLAAYPLGFGMPEDVAHMAVFLLSGEARWITGQNFVLAGGRY